MLMGGVLPADEDRFGADHPHADALCRLGRRARHGQFRSAATLCPRAYKGRLLHVHNPQVTLMRTTAAENDRIGRWIGERLNRMDGPVRFLLPELGVSALDAPGQAFHDPAGRRRAVRARSSRRCARPRAGN